MEHEQKRPDIRPSPGAELDAARRELRALSSRFNSIVNSMADGIVVVDEDGVIRFANEAAGRLFDRDASELVGHTFGHPLVADETTEIDVVRGGGRRVAELRVVDTDWDGGTARVVSLRDITERKRAEEQARALIREQAARAEAEQAARRAEFLAEAGRRLSATLDLETTLQTLTSLVVEELADYCVVDLVEPGGTRRFTAARAGGERRALLREAERYPLDPGSDTIHARVYRDRQPVLVEDVDEDWLRAATRDDDHFELVRSIGPRSLILVPLGTGRDSLGVLTAGCTHSGPFGSPDMHLAAEIARRAALAIENARLYRDADAANRAKANFLSVMSHELRTPLSAVIGYTDLIDRGVVGEVNDDQRKFLGRIRASSNHLLQIIEEILAYAGTEMGEERLVLEETTLGELMDGVIAVTQPLANESGLEYHVQVDAPDARLNTDTRKVRQILVNLISNALKFTQDGEVRVTAGIDDGLVISVRDTGVGIPEDRIDDIFEKFWQVEDPMTRRAGGTGLGLTVAQSFTRLLGGTLDVESEEGVGSTFTLRLPVDPGD